MRTRTVILDDPRGQTGGAGVGGRATLDDLLRRAAQRRPDAHRADRSAQPRELHRRQAAPPHLCAGRSHGLGDRRTAAAHGAAHRCHRRHPDRQHGRKRAHAARRAARRDDRDAAAAAVAAGRMRRRARPRRRQCADRERARSARIDHFELAMQVAAEIFPVRYVCGFGRDRARRASSRSTTCITADKLDPIPPLEARSRRRPGRASRGHHLGRGRRRPRAGRRAATPS